MRKYLLSVLLLLSQVHAESQLVKVWDQRYGGLSGEIISCVIPLNNGNLLLGGHSFSGISGSKSQASYGQSDYWIVCINGSGIKLWDAAYGGDDDDCLTKIIVTSDGGFLLGGFSYSGISGIKTQPSQGDADYWIVKTDSIGNYQWDKRYGGSDHDQLNSLCQTSDGGYIFGGSSASDISGDKSQSTWNNSDDFWVVKIDSIGTKLWDKRFGGIGDDLCYSVVQTPDGDYLLGGMSWSDISGDKSQSSWGGGDYWVVKIDSAGTKIWDRRFGTSENDYCYSACSDGSDGFVLGGETGGGIDGDKTENSWGSNDFWIVHIDGSGNKVWDKRFGGTSSDDTYGNIYRTIDGGYVSSGTSYSDISGNKTQDNLGSEQTWMVKCDSTGNYVIDRTLLDIGHEEIGFAVATNDGCFIVANNTSADYGGDKSQNSIGGTDYFVAEYCLVGPPQANFYIQDTALCEGQCILFSDASIYPLSWSWSFPGGNPSSSTLASPTICYDTSGTYDVQLIVTNMSGNDTIFYPNYITVSPPIATPTITQNGNLLTCNQTASFYQWYFNYAPISGATNQTCTASQTGLYSVMILNNNGCSALSAALNFNVNVVIANFSASDSVFCEGNCLDFTDLSLNTPTTWSWQFTGASPSSSTNPNPSNICYYVPGIYPVTLTVTNQYGQSWLTQTNFITVQSAPSSPLVTQNLDTIFCNAVASSYQWYFQGYPISGATSDFYVTPQTGDYSVVITNSDGCTANTNINVQVPAPHFMVQDSDICEKFCTEFMDQSTNNPISWNWIFEGGTPLSSTDQNPSVCYYVPGVFDVTLITFNGSVYDTLLLFDYMTVFETPPLPTITVNGNLLTASAAYSYQWQYDNFSIPGATNQTYLATQSGVYTLITTSADSCSSQVSIDFHLVGIGNIFQEEEISIHPNPGSGIFTVSLPSSEFQKATLLVVYDVLGKEIFRELPSNLQGEEHLTLDISSANDGVYLILLSENSQTLVAKIIKQQND